MKDIGVVRTGTKYLMNKAILGKFGQTIFRQSIKKWAEPKVVTDTLILGLDTEYYMKDGRNVLISWQIGWDGTSGDIFFTPLTFSAIKREVRRKLGRIPANIYMVTFFITAEAQFFLSADWKVSEYKGKYEFECTDIETTVTVLDLQRWFPGKALADVGKIFGLYKMEYPIVDVVNMVRDGKRSLLSLRKDKEFTKYAMNDAIITGEIYRRIREFFISGHGIDIISSKTPAATSSFIFRKMYVARTIGQYNTKLRQQAMESAWGGRVECFVRGTKPMAYIWDASGHHPSSAIAMSILPVARDWRETVDTKTWVSAKGGLGKISFRFPSDTRYPCLPVLSQGSLIFPLSGISDCTVEEAKLAVELGADLIVIRGFYYNDGTDILQKYLKQMMALRKATTEKAHSEMFKLMANGIVGKLFQKSLTTNLQAVRDYAKKENIPVEVALTTKGLELPVKASVGAMFYPEWYALILGYARTNITRMAILNNALMVSSDSVIIEKPVPDMLDDGIIYTEKGHGEYVAYRSKLYRVGDNIAHHAIHNKDAARKVLDKFIDDASAEYKAKHIVKLRESMRGVGMFGGEVTKDMSISLLYDYKRQLSDGITSPWLDKSRREKFIEEQGR